MHKRMQTSTTPALPTGGDTVDVGPASTVMALCGEAAPAVRPRPVNLDAHRNRRKFGVIES